MPNKLKTHRVLEHPEEISLQALFRSVLQEFATNAGFDSATDYVNTYHVVDLPVALRTIRDCERVFEQLHNERKRLACPDSATMLNIMDANLEDPEIVVGSNRWRDEHVRLEQAPYAHTNPRTHWSQAQFLELFMATFNHLRVSALVIDDSGPHLDVNIRGVIFEKHIDFDRVSSQLALNLRTLKSRYDAVLGGRKGYEFYGAFLGRHRAAILETLTRTRVELDRVPMPSLTYCPMAPAGMTPPAYRPKTTPAASEEQPACEETDLVTPNPHAGSRKRRRLLEDSDDDEVITRVLASTTSASGAVASSSADVDPEVQRLLDIFSPQSPSSLRRASAPAVPAALPAPVTWNYVTNPEHIIPDALVIGDAWEYISAEADEDNGEPEDPESEVESDTVDPVEPDDEDEFGSASDGGSPMHM